MGMALANHFFRRHNKASKTNRSRHESDNTWTSLSSSSCGLFCFLLLLRIFTSSILFSSLSHWFCTFFTSYPLFMTLYKVIFCFHFEKLWILCCFGPRPRPLPIS